MFWLGYFLFNVIRWGSYFNDYWYSIKSNLVEFPLHIIIVYFNIYVLYPRFLLKKKYLHFFVWFTATLIAHYITRTGLNYLLVTENIWPEAVGHQRAFTFNHIVAVSTGEVYVIALVSTIKLTIDWILEKRRNHELQQEQLKTELRFLKSQIQPHFFFNTLNNLYALSIEKSDAAPQMILKLSDIMQYVLYDANQPAIALRKEINYIHSYLELEKLRYGNRFLSDIEIEGNIEGVRVPPLLFLPFIENCFKHGTRESDFTNVHIGFQHQKNQLLFEVVNNFCKDNNQMVKHGIGIKNVQQRLDLLYKDQYQLHTYIENNNYFVKLKLPLV